MKILLTWVVSDDPVVLEPLWFLVVQGLVEDQQHGQEVAGQAGVVYQVVHADLNWKGDENNSY